MSRIICSPSAYVQGKGELTKIAGYCKAMGCHKAYVMTSPSNEKRCGPAIKKGFDDEKMSYEFVVFGGECSDDEIQKHLHQLNDADIVIGVGGGKTLDTAKAVADTANIRMIIVPTIASTDAPCSRLSVVYTNEGAFDHYLPLKANPDMVIMDEDIIVKAPVRFLVAGIGDALATYYEAAACNEAGKVTTTGGHVTNAAMAVAKCCRDTLFKDGYKAKLAVMHKQCTPAVTNIIEANTYMSGVGFESGGLAAAHAIHDGLTVLKESHDYLHGEKVAYGLLCQLVMENKSEDEINEVISFCKKVGLPTCLKDLGLDQATDEELMEAAKASCAPEETIHNLPFPVTSEDVFAAIKVANELGK